MPTTEIIPLILNYVLGGGLLGFIGYFIHYRSKRRTAAAEATTTEHAAESAALRNMHESLVEWKETAKANEIKLDAKDAKLDEKDLVITKLYLEKGEDRKENHRLTSENARLAMELLSSQFVECRRRGCAALRNLTIDEFYEKLNTKNNSTNFPNLLCG